MDIKQQLLAAMAHATSQKPVETAKLYPLGERDQVEAALLELYRAHAVGCCKIINGSERIVWWPTRQTVFSPVGPHRPYTRIGGAP
jgi:hypothetical protein